MGKNAQAKEIKKEISEFDIVCHIKQYEKSNRSFHWHERYEICQVLSGECKFLVDGQMLTAGVGDVICIKEQIVHQFIILSNETRIRIFQFPQQMLISVSDTNLSLKPHITSDEINGIENLGEQLEHLFSIIEREGYSKSMYKNSFAKHIATAIYLLLERHFSVSGNSQSYVIKGKKLFFEIAEFINSHYKENINITRIASAVFISRTKLSALFKKYSGESINAYINKLRIEEAKFLILADKPITAAALECGFQSIRSFNSAFKKYEGVNPREYVKQNGGNK